MARKQGILVLFPMKELLGNMIALTLERTGYGVTLLHSGRAALDEVRMRRFTAVIVYSDGLYDMPGRSFIDHFLKFRPRSRFLLITPDIRVAYHLTEECGFPDNRVIDRLWMPNQAVQCVRAA